MLVKVPKAGSRGPWYTIVLYSYMQHSQSTVPKVVRYHVHIGTASFPYHPGVGSAPGLEVCSARLEPVTLVVNHGLSIWP